MTINSGNYSVNCLLTTLPVDTADSGGGGSTTINNYYNVTNGTGSGDNNYTSSIYFNGTTTGQTLNLARLGMTNLTAYFPLPICNNGTENGSNYFSLNGDIIYNDTKNLSIGTNLSRAALTVVGNITTITIGDVTGLTGDINYTQAKYTATGYSFNMRVYAYKTTTHATVYSANYAILGADITDNGDTFSTYDTQWYWDCVSGADGYVMLYFDTFNSYNYDYYALTTTCGASVYSAGYDWRNEGLPNVAQKEERLYSNGIDNTGNYMQNNGSFVIRGTSTESSITGAGTRFMWQGGALRIGTASGSEWDAPAAGSTVIGSGSTAAASSIALGNGNQVLATTSFSAGSNNIVGSGYGAVALGQDNFVAGGGAVVMGIQSNASGDGAVAIGYLCKSTGLYSFSAGREALASQENSVAIGKGAQATGFNALAIGTNTQSAGGMALGSSSITTGSGKAALAGGIASGSNAIAIACTASGSGSVCMTGGASGTNAISIGGSSTGTSALSFGGAATGNYSMALGHNINANVNSSYIIGSGQTPTGSALNNSISNSLLVGFNATSTFSTSLANTTSYVDFYSSHYLGGGNAPTIVAGAGAGTSPTVSITGKDTAGLIQVTTGTLPTLSAIVATIKFNASYSASPYCVVSPANSNTALLSGVTMVYLTDNVGNFTITAGTTALTAATAYQWYYGCIG